MFGLRKKMPVITRLSILSGLFILLIGSVMTADGQTRRRKSSAKNVPAKSATPAETAVDQPEPKASPTPPKRNERPDTSGLAEKKKVDAAPVSPAYRYEFSQPDFVVSYILIEHNEAGTGNVSFRKKGGDEMITDPIVVSPKALERINAALTNLNFLDSTGSYQYEKDFSHLGTINFALFRDGRTREVSYNWTENKDAKTLMNEYRKIANQFIWIFDISLSRENQPLEAPRLFDNLDSMIRRNEISDPYQMEPFLKELQNDERIPLIARNHASRFIKQFEKERKKNEK